MFSMLGPSQEGRKRRSVAFVCGLLAESLAIGALIFLGILFPEELPLTNRHFLVTWLSKPEPPAERVVKPPVKVAQVFVPKVKPPAPPELPKAPVLHLEIPKNRPIITAAAPTAPPPPLLPKPVAEPTPQPKVQVAVNTGLFGGAAEKVTTKRPASEVQTGGFGSPQGLPGRAQGDSAGNVPKLGSFGLPEGPGVGNGTGGAHGIQGVVASAGFGSGIAGPGAGSGGPGGPKVTTGGFAAATPATPVPGEKRSASVPTVFQPVEIFSKPNPTYTEEARRLGVQGEVALSVVFEATGSIRVISVVKSLGHGLDQAAVQAASQIRFKPALRDGKPADFPATLRIEFRLADQSS